MVSALFSIYSNGANVSDIGKLSEFISCFTGKFTNFAKGSVVSTTELLHPTDKMLKKGPLTKLQLYKQLV